MYHPVILILDVANSFLAKIPRGPKNQHGKALNTRQRQLAGQPAIWVCLKTGCPRWMMWLFPLTSQFYDFTCSSMSPIGPTIPCQKLNKKLQNLGVSPHHSWVAYSLPTPSGQTWLQNHPLNEGWSEIRRSKISPRLHWKRPHFP